ncbi:transposase [bacterium]|nr:transposase [bacterium]
MQLVDDDFEAERPQIAPVQGEFFGLDSEDLEVRRSLDSVVVFCRGFCFFTFHLEDRFSRNYCIVQLHLAGGISLRSLSVLFGLSYPYCSRILSRFKFLGIDGLRDEMAKRFGNRGIIDEQVGRFIESERAIGKSYEQIADLIRFSFKKKLRPASIRNWVSRVGKASDGQSEGATSEQLLMEVGQETFSAADLGSWRRNIYAGSMILYAMVERSGFLRPFEEYIREDFSKKQTAAGVRRVMLTLFFLHAIRGRSIEQSKHIVGQDFCQIVGGDFFRLQSLRYAVDEIVDAEGFERAIDFHFKDLIRLTERGDTVYYTDGHFSTYYGKSAVPKGWDPRRQMPFKGRNTIFLHNSIGQVVYFFESATNTTLSTDIERLIEDVEKLGMKLKRRTLLFDRGGFSQRCFHFLKIRKKMYFATYLKHRKKERKIDESQFRSCAVDLENGDKIDYLIFEGEKRWARCGQIRVIIFLADDGRQIPVLTNNPYLKAETIVYLLSRRWREENCFKYMIEHFGIDLLTTYKVEDAPDKIIKRPNPDRQAINKEIAKKRGELLKVRAELADKLMARAGQTTFLEFFEQEKQLEMKIKNVQVDIDLLVRKKNGIAPQIEVNLKDSYVIMAQKRRLFINAIKAMNYNSEKWLQPVFAKFHAKTDETLSLIRSLWRHPGRIREDGQMVEVELDPIDIKAMHDTVAKTLEDLSKNNHLRLPDGKLLRIKLMRPS